MTDLNKLCTEISQFGGNPWTQFTAVDHGWEAIMLRGVVISDREFEEVLNRFPYAPIDQDVLHELIIRGFWQDDHDPTPEQLSAVDTPPLENVLEQPARQISDKDMRSRNRLLAAVDRAEEQAERRRRR